MHKRTLLRHALLAIGISTLAGQLHAQDFPPRKPVTLVVGFAAGGAADAAARLIAKKLHDAGVKDALDKHGLTPQPTTRAELAAFMQKEDAKWTAIVRERKITAQ